jgi:hypothetical protein
MAITTANAWGNSWDYDKSKRQKAQISAFIEPIHRYKDDNRYKSAVAGEKNVYAGGLAKEEFLKSISQNTNNSCEEYVIAIEPRYSCLFKSSLFKQKPTPDDYELCRILSFDLFKNDYKIPEIPIIDELISPTISGVESAHSDVSFPSTQLATVLLNGIISRARSYQSIGVLNDESLSNELDLEISDLKAIIIGSIKQTISTLASIASQQDIEKVAVSEEGSLTVIFEDLIKQYLPPISSETICSIGPILIKELVCEVKSRMLVVDSGKLEVENDNLYILITKNYSLPGLLGTDEFEFIKAADI